MASETTEPPVPNENDSQKSESGSDQQMADSKEHVKNYLRVSKDCLYMIIALWMENFPVKADTEKVEQDPDHHKVGAVLVLPNEIVCGADCSRDGVHAVARLLTKHHDKAKGSKMFMSRKPCPMCAKLLVQSKVERVLFLPFEPEYYRLARPGYDKDTLQEFKDIQTTRVDSLFNASAIAETKFTLQVEEPVVDRMNERTPTKLEEKVKWVKQGLNSELGFDKERGWEDFVQEKLPWQAFDDDMKDQFKKYFKKVMKWIAVVLVARGKGSDCKFHQPFNDSNPTEGDDPHSNVFDPIRNPVNERQARHFIEIARFLAERTDDPKTGVGAVIVSPEMEVLGFGWNGFPLKAHYGEFGRAPRKSKAKSSKSAQTTSQNDESKEGVKESKPSEQKQKPADKKYPYIIHAEQNALLMRNKKDIKGAILFVTKPPCNECAPLLAAEGIATVVVDDDVKPCNPPKLDPPILDPPKLDLHTLDELKYDKFPKMAKGKEAKFVCYQTSEKPTDEKDILASEEVSRKIEYDSSGAKSGEQTTS